MALADGCDRIPIRVLGVLIPNGIAISCKKRLVRGYSWRSNLIWRGAT